MSARRPLVLLTNKILQIYKKQLTNKQTDKPYKLLFAGILRSQQASKRTVLWSQKSRESQKNKQLL